MWTWSKQQSSSPTLAAALLPCCLPSFLLPRSAREDVSGRPIIFHLIQQQFWTFVGDVTFHLDDCCIWKQPVSQSVSQSLVQASVRLVTDKTSFPPPHSVRAFSCLVFFACCLLAALWEVKLTTSARSSTPLARSLLHVAHS